MLLNYGFHCLLLICSLRYSMGSQYREVWRANPDEHIKGVTYEKLQEVIQKYVVENHNKRTLQGGSFAADVELEHDLREYYGEYTIKTKPCLSFLRNCQRQPSAAFTLCVSAENDRRYDYLLSHGDVVGRDRGQCLLNQTFSKLPLICDCESHEREIDRYFSLLDVVSDDDKVVTGVRLKKDNHVFHIQIQQGTLGPFGTIEGEATWKDIRTIPTSELLSKEISEPVGISGLWSTWSRELWLFPKNPVVYAITTKQFTVLLDDVVADNGLEEVVTGLRFRQVGDDLGLEVQLTPYEHSTGELKRSASRWAHNEIDKRQRKLIAPWNSADPSLHGGYSLITVSANNKYVKFTPSTFVRDLGQRTVPFIDIQDVVDRKPSPLVGAGIIHKGRADSAGFIALKGFFLQ